MNSAPAIPEEKQTSDRSEDFLVEIQAIRNRLVNTGLIFFSIIGPFAFLLSLARIVEHGWHPVYLVHLFIVVAIIIVTLFRHRLAYKIRALILLGFTFIIGAIGLFIFGLPGGGLSVLIIFAILTALLFGTRAGLIACAIDLVILAIAGSLICTGAIRVPFDIQEYATSLTGWMVNAVFFIMYIPLSVIFVGVIYHQLADSLKRTRESQRKHLRLVDNLKDTFLYRQDTEGVINYVSSSITQVLGYSTEEFLKHYSTYMTDAPKNQKAIENTEQAIQGNRQPLYEAQYFHKDGSTRWLEVSELPVFNQNGQVIAVEGVAHNITKRKETEIDLKESKEKYHSLFENANDAIFVMKDDRFIDCNSKTLEMFTCRKEDIIGQTPFRFSPEVQPDGSISREKAIDKITSALNGIPQFFEWRHCRLDETYFHAEISLNRLEIGGETHVLAIVRDITQRKEYQAELQRFAMVIEQSSEIVVVTDIAGNITYVNPAFEKVTGYSKEEVLGQNPRILKSGKMEESVYKDLWDTILEGKTWNGRLINKKKDGRFFVEETSISPLRSETGEIINFVAVKKDITRELQLEEQFFQSQKMEAIGQLAGGVAHDFNNLLQVIQGYGEMALEESKGRTIHKDLEQVIKAADSATTLVRQLLAFSRKQKLELEELNLSDVVSDLAKMIKRVIGEHIAFHLNLEPGLKLVRADRGQIEQILMNLCVNARDAMPEGGTLTIQTGNTFLDKWFCQTNTWAQPGNYVVLSVTDTGIGMDPETKRRIFEPFFTTKGKGQGTGLGLSTVFGIVRQHDGMINVYSELGVGTTFRIYLPMIEEMAALVRENEKTEVRGGTETILLADDDEGVRGVAESILTRFGYQVLSARDGKEAIEIFEKRSDEIDLALLDVVMPNLGGKAVHDHIKSKNPEVKVLFASGYSSGGVHQNFILEEDTQLIQKPYRRDDLLRKIREVLED